MAEVKFIVIFLQVNAQMYIYIYVDLKEINLRKDTDRMGNNLKQLYKIDNELQLQLQSKQMMKVSKSIDQKYNIGIIISKHSQQPSIVKGIAIMISPNLIITAALNTINLPAKKSAIFKFNEQKQLAINEHIFKFYPIINGQIREQKGYQFDCVRYSSQFTEQVKEQLQYEFAIIRLAGCIQRPSESFLPLEVSCNVCMSSIYSIKYVGITALIQNQAIYFKNKAFKIEMGTNKFKIYENYFLNQKINAIIFQNANHQLNGFPVYIKNKLIGINIQTAGKTSTNIIKLFNKQTLKQIRKWANQMNGNQLIINDKRICFHAQTLQQDLEAKRYFDQGFNEYNNQFYSIAIINFSKSIKHNPIYFEAYLKRGLSYKQLQHFQDSIKDFDKAIEINPNQSRVHFHRGQSFSQSKRYEQAIANFTRAIQIDPNFADAYFSRAFAYQNINDCDNVRIDIDRVLQMQPNNHSAFHNKGILLTIMKDYNNALQCFFQAIQINPREADYYYRRGFIYGELKDHKNEIEDYDKALKIDPLYSEAYHSKGQAYEKLKDYKKAIQNYDMAIKINPSYADCHYEKGLCLNYLKNYRNAILSFDRAIKLNSNHFSNFNKGISLYYLQDYKSAIMSYDIAIELNPDQSYYYLKKGLALFRYGDHQKAIQSFDKAVEKSSQELADHYYLKSLSFEMLKNQEDSIMNKQKALMIDKDIVNKYPEINKIVDNFISQCQRAKAGNHFQDDFKEKIMNRL